MKKRIRIAVPSVASHDVVSYAALSEAIRPLTVAIRAFHEACVSDSLTKEKQEEGAKKLGRLLGHYMAWAVVGGMPDDGLMADFVSSFSDSFKSNGLILANAVEAAINGLDTEPEVFGVEEKLGPGAPPSMKKSSLN